MQALTPLQRGWVWALLAQGGKDNKRAAIVAGYSEASSHQQGYLNAHNPKIIRAVREEADRRLRSGALLGASVLLEIAGDVMHKDRYKAAVELLDRSGLLVVREQRISVEHKDDAAMVDRIIVLARTLGLDPTQLLGSAGVEVKKLPAPIDVEYVEVTPAPEGLEDLFE